MPGRDTRVRIMETARRLFNKHGTAAISTNHIAKELGISPGNLYYHFRNKEEIIREIFERMVEVMSDFWSYDRLPSLEDLQVVSNRVIFLMWDYRFFCREIVVLLRKDPALKWKYRTWRGQWSKESESFFYGLVQSGVLRQPEDPSTLPTLLKVFWLIIENWLPYLDMRGQTINRKNVQESVDLGIQILRPHMSKKALAQLSLKKRA